MVSSVQCTLGIANLQICNCFFKFQYFLKVWIAAFKILWQIIFTMQPNSIVWIYLWPTEEEITCIQIFVRCLWLAFLCWAVLKNWCKFGINCLYVEGISWQNDKFLWCYFLIVWGFLACSPGSTVCATTTSFYEMLASVESSI